MSTKCRPQAWRQSLASSHIPLSLVVPAKDSAPVAIDEDMVAVVMCVTLDGVVGGRWSCRRLRGVETNWCGRESRMKEGQEV